MRRAEGLLVLLLGCAPAAAAPQAALPAAAAPLPAAAAPLPAPSPATPKASPATSALPAAIASAPATATAKKAVPTSTASLTDDALVKQVLSGGTTLKTVMAAPEKYRFQVLYGAITNGTLDRRGFRADAEYFFPASSMKVPIALSLYTRLATLRAGGKPAFTRDATIKIHPTGAGDPYVTTLARETWRALIVSDNFSANRLLGAVGHREANETLWALGLPSARIHTGFATGADIDPAEVSPRIELVSGAATAELPARKSDLVLKPTDARSLDIGKANIGANGQRVEAPLSFADKNAMRLKDLQDALIRIMRPELLPAYSADVASKDDIAYVREALGTLPSESGLAGFDRNVVADYSLSPFLRGIERVRPRGKFQIFSKVGQAFGFLIANAYIVDKESGKAFFLTAAIYANLDEVMNDDKYDYDETSFPALADVGEAFCRQAFP